MVPKFSYLLLKHSRKFRFFLHNCLSFINEKTEAPSAIYALELFGIIGGVLTTAVAVFSPKVSLIYDDPDEKEVLNLDMASGGTALTGNHTSNGRKQSHQSRIEIQPASHKIGITSTVAGSAMESK